MRDASRTLWAHSGGAGAHRTMQVHRNTVGNYHAPIPHKPRGDTVDAIPLFGYAVDIDIAGGA